jgi:hypothetical protein
LPKTPAAEARRVFEVFSGPGKSVPNQFA